MLKYGIPKPIGFRIFWLFFLWAMLVTAASTVSHDYASFMPLGATTPYPVFILLRFFTLLSFVASVYVALWLLQQGCREHVIKAVVTIGCFISVAALYIYAAQIYGLPELPRNRLGTAGGLQAIRFTYDFHRAIGTFREPSLLAAWLIVPLFLASRPVVVGLMCRRF